jgi:hypothetical protein
MKWTFLLYFLQKNNHHVVIVLYKETKSESESIREERKERKNVIFKAKIIRAQL